MRIIQRIRARFYLRKSRWLMSRGRGEEAAAAAFKSELLFRKLAAGK